MWDTIRQAFAPLRPYRKLLIALAILGAIAGGLTNYNNAVLKGRASILRQGDDP